MDLDTLKNLIQTTPWFNALGQASPPTKEVIYVGAEQWTQFISASTSAEFGLSHNATALKTFPFAEFEWLPHLYAEDPLRAEMLIAKGRQEEIEENYKAARRYILKLSQVALRSASDPPLLVIGSANLTGAARSAALFACRTAAAEIALNRPGFWCDMVLLYHAGRWPFGRMQSGEVLVL